MITGPEDDVSSFVRDASQLSESDIKTFDNIARMLQPLWLTDHPQEAGSGLPMIEDFLESTAREKVESDDFYSTAYRLVGFGLVLELPTKTGRRSSNNIRFAATGRSRNSLRS